MIREQAIHKDVIIAFLEGKEVQYFSRKTWEWVDTDAPLFSVGTEYRVKPDTYIAPDFLNTFKDI